ncbi:MAG: IS4 family transposase [Planctomycetota bacterium]|jgi:IS4 transposase
MSHQDRKSKGQIVVNHESIKQAVNSLFAARAFRGVKVRKGAKWTPRMMVVVALFWAWSKADGLKERFKEGRKVAAKIFRWLPDPGKTYNGFMKQLRKWHVELQLLCMGELRVLMKQELFGQWKIAGYVIIAGDGSRIELPRTESNEKAYSPKRKKKESRKKGKGKRKSSRGKRWRKTKRQSEESIRKKANSPQMWLTLFWHVGTGLPWAWRTGPSDSSERQHLQEMLGELPENTLITADAGFVGYEFWSAVIAAGHHFVIRAGANVRLLRKLGFTREYDNTVYLWPDWASKKGLPPLVLRVVWVHNGKHPMCLITNVMSKKRLSDRQISQIYKARWGVELFFRTFKQTFGRRKLRSHTAEHAQLEAEWSLVALWAVCLLAQREIANSGGNPCRLSPGGAIKAIQEVMCHYRNRPDEPTESLVWMLRNALQDDYQRTSSKTARAYPTKRKRERTGVPKVARTSKSQVNVAKEFRAKRPQLRLPA